MSTDKTKTEMERSIEETFNTMLGMLINHSAIPEADLNAGLGRLSAAFEQAGFWESVSDMRRGTFREDLSNLLRMSKGEDRRDPRTVAAIDSLIDKHRDRLGTTIRLAIVN